jgi:hypothetical protein
VFNRAWKTGSEFLYSKEDDEHMGREIERKISGGNPAIMFSAVIGHDRPLIVRQEARIIQAGARFGAEHG